MTTLTLTATCRDNRTRGWRPGPLPCRIPGHPTDTAHVHSTHELLARRLQDSSPGYTRLLHGGYRPHYGRDPNYSRQNREAIKTLKCVYRLDYYPSIHPTIVKNVITIMKISNILASIVKKLAEAEYGIRHDVNLKINTQACEMNSMNFMYDALYSAIRLLF